ncbi:DUF1330 domain-containing protein [Cognatishimia activa]|uniref:DUF1330 domain-containing protein n=1 Tax=Cognatishimia activa TaxID=1715691 RepID=A0A0P1IR39_9RHOB|nr:DUF1330 domain-containing protein [Cognatishimia activa]MEE2944448.1 DUF1330 domain-containing protein [Pseudomonadota bacterium]CUJ06797.1 hypothetical protein TA5113_02223 [Cognatishimia activa]CUK25997.1 hypothetical protein TA5114_01803 [Cognatishimia activa]
MTAYAMVTITVTDPDKLAAYREVAGPAMAKHGVSPLAVSGDAQVIEGNGAAPNVTVILQFENREAALGWINDPEIAEVHKMRQAAGDSRIVLM